MQKIDIYLVEKNITTTKLQVAQNLFSRDIFIKTIKGKEVEKLKKEDSGTKVLKTKAKLA